MPGNLLTQPSAKCRAKRRLSPGAIPATTNAAPSGCPSRQIGFDPQNRIGGHQCRDFCGHFQSTVGRQSLRCRRHRHQNSQQASQSKSRSHHVSPICGEGRLERRGGMKRDERHAESRFSTCSPRGHGGRVRRVRDSGACLPISVPCSAAPRRPANARRARRRRRAFPPKSSRSANAGGRRRRGP